MKTAIVTGGAGGLGVAIAARLAEADYKVGVLDQTQEQAVKAAIGIRNAIALQADVRSEESVEAALDTFGEVPDLLVNNAGIARFAPLMEQTYDDFRSVVDVNLIGRVNAVAPGFINAGMSAPFLSDPAVRDIRIGAVPTRSLGAAKDVAEAVFYLASDAARYVSGHELVVDGGVTHSLLAQIPREAKDMKD